MMFSSGGNDLENTFLKFGFEFMISKNIFETVRILNTKPSHGDEN